MSEVVADESVSARYDRLSAALGETVAAVPDGRWEEPSPCAGWTARDVVRHLVDVHRTFVEVAGGQLEEVPAVGDDPVAAWDAVRSAVSGMLSDPAYAEAEYDGPFGRARWGESIDMFLCFDLVVHRWDLARACGLDEQLPPQDVQFVRKRTEQLGDNLRREGVCGPELTPPEDVDDQTRLLAFLGRRAW